MFCVKHIYTFIHTCFLSLVWNVDCRLMNFSEVVHGALLNVPEKSSENKVLLVACI